MAYKWLIQRLIKKLQRRENTIDSENREPLDHPALSRMTLAQLADLPMPSYVKESCNGVIRVN
jgi:hypothetical protein